MIMEPNIHGYQLIGDNQLFRFSVQILGKKIIQTEKVIHVGLCGNSQGIRGLIDRIENNFYPVSTKVILMIGIREVLKKHKLSSMKEDTICLLEALFRKGVMEIMILTILPIPRLQKSPDHWHKIKYYNEFLKSLPEKSEKITIIDAYSKFVMDNPLSWDYNKNDYVYHYNQQRNHYLGHATRNSVEPYEIKLNLFEEFHTYGPNCEKLNNEDTKCEKKLDNLHLNNAGLMVIEELISIELMDKESYEDNFL